jgi:hypothetical protein
MYEHCNANFSLMATDQHNHNPKPIDERRDFVWKRFQLLQTPWTGNTNIGEATMSNLIQML